jgi:serine/threonine protein kinase/tetratricopeptide (TPR) repeat protein
MAEAPDDSSLVGRKLGRFRVVSKLGKGGIATVWKATDELLKRTVALKILDRSFQGSASVLRRFAHEPQSAARLQHPGIVTVFDADTCEGLNYIALTYVDGSTVSELASRRLMPIPEAVRIGIAAAEALEHAHARGVIHRDVTGRNIMVAIGGRVFVLDFSLAYAIGMTRITSSEATLGTVAYMAPEALVGKARELADLERCDIYGLGVVLFEALTGTLPFADERIEVMAAAKLNCDPLPPSRLRPDMPAELDRIVLRAIARDPERRYPAISEMLTDLRSVAAKSTDRASPINVIDHGREAAVAPTYDRLAGHESPVLPRVFLAVLPFEDTDLKEPDEKRSMFAQGLSDAIASALAGNEYLVVVSGEEPAIREGTHAEIARRLGANRLLVGSVRRSGSRLRVTFSVLDPLAGVRVAGGTTDGSSMDLFALEDQLIADVARALGIEDAAHKAPSRSARGDSVAHEQLLQARGYLLRYDNQGAVEGAIRLLENLIRQEGESAERLALLARALLTKYRITHEPSLESRAASACERALQLEPDSHQVLLTLGDLRLASGQFDAALEAFDRSHHTRPSAEAMVGRSRALEALGEPRAAEETLNDAIAMRPDAWASRNWLGLLLFHVARYRDAIAEWERALALTPDNVRLLANLAAAHVQLGEFDAAVGACERALEIQPTARALMTLGASCYYLGRFEDAARAYERAVALQPSDPMAWSGLGTVCRQIPDRSERVSEALRNAELLLRDRIARSGDPLDWARLAACQCNQDRLDEARVSIERAIVIRPDHVEVMISAVGVYQRTDPTRALDWLKRAKESGYGLAGVTRDPALVPLRSQSEFWSIVGITPPKEEGR